MPSLVLGFGFMGLATFLGSFALLLGVVMTFGGGADMFIILLLLFYPTKDKEVLILDYPYKLGSVIFEKQAEGAR